MFLILCAAAILFYVGHWGWAVGVLIGGLVCLWGMDS